MLYLEDYLEMIEHLPSELRDRFTEMREMDLSVQNRVDSLEERQKTFFSNCKKSKPGPERDEELEKIRREYKKVIEEASEKITSADDCYNLVDRYLRKLDQELHKFKMELEADNRGITEVLEKRSLEMDTPTTSYLKENRHPRKHVRKHHTTTVNTTPGSNSSHERKSFNLSNENSLGGPMEALMSSSPLAQPSNTSGTYPLQHMGAGGNAIAVAASQAIQATQQMVPGRRTSSLKASYEAINLGVQTHEFSIGRELAGAAQSALAATAIGQQGLANPAAPTSAQVGTSGAGPAAPTEGDATPLPSKRQKISKRSSTISLDTSNTQQMLDVGMMDEALLDPSLVSNSPTTEELLAAGSSQDPEWNYDPSEPRYCICNQVSYGDMVACDNQDCPYEWFHYPCVGISAPPKGKWYCPTCLANMARRKGRK